MAITAGVTAVASLGYGIYAGQQAQSAQKNAIAQANQNAQNAQAQQQQQYQQQVAAEQAQNAANVAQQQQTLQQTEAAQTAGLAQEQAAIGTNSTTLQNSLTAQEQAAMAKQAPIIAGQVNASGLTGGGASAEALAQAQAGLDANAQADLASYQVSADQQLNVDTNAATAEQVQQQVGNTTFDLGAQQQDMAQNFATQGADNANNVAYQQYLTSLQLGQAQSQQAAANSYTGLAGAIGQGALSYYGGQNGLNSQLAANTNPSMQAYLAAGYGTGNNTQATLGPSWNGGNVGSNGFAQ